MQFQMSSSFRSMATAQTQTPIRPSALHVRVVLVSARMGAITVSCVAPHCQTSEPLRAASCCDEVEAGEKARCMKLARRMRCFDLPLCLATSSPLC